jgi:D-glycero-D-manno-heptose 1,7-bisphosphate phosphatase
MTRPAVFLDRDETLIEDPGFISDPDQVCLKPGATDAIRRWRRAGFAIIVVSNQSGVARGLITMEQLDAVHERLATLLAGHGAAVDAIYACPYLDGPEAVVERYRRDSELRKPKPGMLLQAAQERELDLSRSWMIGDRASDVEAGRLAGCRTILIALSDQHGDNGGAAPDFHAESLVEAATIVETQSDPPTEPIEPASESTDAQIVARLTEIRELLDRQQRAARQDDFSFLRLFGTLAQMLAIVMAVWGLIGMLNADTMPHATARLVLASFFQLVTLTTFMVERRS